MARLRGKTVLAHVALGSLQYGFRTNLALHTKHKGILGQTTFIDAVGVFFGANSPKPPRASKEFADGVESSFCSTANIDKARKDGWTVTKKANRRGVKTAGKTRAVYVDMPGGWKYAWNITQAEAGLSAELGFVEATGGEASSLIWGVNSPKPPRARKLVAAEGTEGGYSVSTFVKPQASVLDAAVAAGYTISGIDYDLLPNATP